MVILFLQQTILLTMNIDWQDALKSLKDTGDLPEGESGEEDIVSTDKPAPKGKLVVSMEKKGRGGKTVTIISGFAESHEEVEALAATLKSKLGTGGSARGGEILIQGDRRPQVKELLIKLGYKF